jgi:dienelactone hydrolase
MSRILMCAAAGALFISTQAVAQEKVSFPATDGDLKGGTPTTITGYLYKPTGSGPFAAVVGLHGGGGLVSEKGEIDPLNGQWGEILSRAGYIVLLVDSFRPRGYGSIEDRGFSVSPIIEMPRDAFGAMTYLRSRPDVRPDRIAVMGQSYGGGATLATIANGALPKDVKDFRAAVAFYPGCIRIQDAHRRPRMPMLLLMGESDDFGSLARCKEFVAGGPPIDADFYPNTYHAFDWPNLPRTVVTNAKVPPDGHSPTIGSNPEARADAINRVTQFLAKQLQ